MLHPSLLVMNALTISSDTVTLLMQTIHIILQLRDYDLGNLYYLSLILGSDK